MQIGVDIGSYKFDASEKTIEFIGVDVNNIAQIKPIVNADQGEVIFNPATVGSFGTLSDNILTLDYDTTTHNDTDVLYLCVKFSDDIKATEKTLQSVSLDTTRVENLLNILIEEQQLTNKTLRKIYNPE